MRILVCGDRNWSNKWIMADAITNFCWKMYYHKGISEFEIIEGEASGADTLAREIAEELGWKVHKFPAEWNYYGKAAGPIRNTQMLKEGQPDYVLAFHNDLKNSKGTKDMVNKAHTAGIPYEVISE